MNPMSSYKLSLVSYQNTLPFEYALNNYTGNGFDISVEKSIPAECAKAVLSGKTDIGIIPVAATIDYPELSPISSFCIGSKGAVETVLLVSDVPVEDLSVIMLDYQSRTSNLLVKVLSKFWWNIGVDFEQSVAGYEEHVKADRGAVIIGDRAFGLKHKYKYCYDLSEEWLKMTGTPFVFAAWYSAKGVGEMFIEEFNKMLNDGLGKYWLSEEYQNLPGYLKYYLTRNISYDFDRNKKESLRSFMQYARKIM